MANVGAGGNQGNSPDLIGNKAPTLRLERDKHRTARAGDAVDLTASATDDDKPKPRAMPSFVAGSRQLPNTATGLRLSWFLYRGPAPVAFDPPQIKVWEDTRDGGNSPWAPGWKTPPAPPDNKWVVRATFNEPGTYWLRCLASDGALTTSEDVTVVVNR